MHALWNALFVSAVSAAVTFTVPSKSGDGSYKYTVSTEKKLMSYLSRSFSRILHMI